MLFRYYYELIVGALAVIAILFLGNLGNTTFVLAVALPIIMRIKKTKIDEREFYVFYKAANLTMGLLLFCMLLINLFENLTINGHLIGANWLSLSVASLFVSHGLSGLIMNRI